MVIGCVYQWMADGARGRNGLPAVDHVGPAWRHVPDSATVLHLTVVADSARALQPSGLPATSFRVPVSQQFYHSSRMCNLRILKVFENSRTFRNFKTWNEFKIFVHLFYFYFVNFLRLLQLVNVTSNQSDCLLNSNDVNHSTELLWTDRDTTVHYQYRSAELCSVAVTC